MRKAFGRVAGVAAIVLALGVIGGLLALVGLGAFGGAFPVMVVLGPAMVVQYAYWRRRRGAERTTWQFQAAEGLTV